MLLVGFLCPQQVFSQIDDLDEIFDEGPDRNGMRDYNPHIFKIHLNEWYLGDASLYYERRFDNNTSLQVGAGPNWPVMFLMDELDFPSPLILFVDDTEPQVGWAASLAGRKYGYLPMLGDQLYVGALVKYRHNRFADQDPLGLAFAGITTGVQLEPIFGFVVNLQTGIGARLSTRPLLIDGKERNFIFWAPMRVGVGFSF